MLGIIGEKIGMSQIFKENGEAIPVSIVEAGPCQVVQVKMPKKEGYSAIQLGFIEKPEHLTNKAEKGHFKSAKVKPYKYLEEFREFEADYCKVGEKITVDLFKEGDSIKVTGISIGKGFQGVVKRYNFRGGPKTHGQSDRIRAGGSIGASAYPSRVIKGVKMPGRMGGKRVTTRGLRVIKIDRKNNLLYIKGAIPGPRSAL